ncbi:MAG: STAS domain-containing protein [Verrucomicrobiota bacterium]
MTLEETNIDGAEVLRLIGEADLAAVPELQEKLAEKRDAGTDLLILDFAKTTFVNTPVWALIVEYYQFTLKEKKHFALAGLGGRVLASFEIVQLGKFIDHFSNVEEAIAAKR